LEAESSSREIPIIASIAGKGDRCRLVRAIILPAPQQNRSQRGFLCRNVMPLVWGFSHYGLWRSFTVSIIKGRIDKKDDRQDDIANNNGRIRF